MATLDAGEVSKQIVAYVMVPAWAQGARPDLRDALDSDRMCGMPDPVLTHWLNNSTPEISNPVSPDSTVHCPKPLRQVVTVGTPKAILSSGVYPHGS